MTEQNKDEYELALEVTHNSEAVWKFWKFSKKLSKDSFVDAEPYSIRFKFKNIGKNEFPAGAAIMVIEWTSRQYVTWPLKIPSIESGNERFAIFPNEKDMASSEVLAPGYGLIFCRKLIASDRKQIALFNWEMTQRLHCGERDVPAIHSIRARTWQEIESRYALIASAIALAIIASEKIWQLLLYIFQILVSLIN